MNHVKPIRLSAHALGYSSSRGFTVAEVEDAIRTAAWQPAASGRLECNKDFAYDAEWNGRTYALSIDYAADGRIAGIEILDARRRIGSNDVLRRIEIENVITNQPIGVST